MTERNLDFDQGMSLVVIIARHSFAVGAEVGVVANSTLVTITSNVATILTSAERAIAENPTVMLSNGGNVWERFVERSKAVATMLAGDGLVALGADIIVWA